VSNTDHTVCLNPGDDGQRFMVVAAVFVELLSWDRPSQSAQLAAQIPKDRFGGRRDRATTPKEMSRNRHNFRVLGSRSSALRLLIHSLEIPDLA
jgi:hypothetical protein